MDRDAMEVKPLHRRRGLVDLRSRTSPRGPARAKIRTGSVCALLVLLLLGPPTVRAGQENQGLQGGWAIDDSGNLNFTSSLSMQAPTLHEAEAGWLRINFRLGKCFDG
jgi:hypothetical protein